MGGEGDAIAVLHLGGISEHEGGLGVTGKAVDLGTADAVVGGGCGEAESVSTAMPQYVLSQ